jgi:hypothetical protein
MGLSATCDQYCLELHESVLAQVRLRPCRPSLRHCSFAHCALVGQVVPSLHDLLLRALKRLWIYSGSLAWLPMRHDPIPELKRQLGELLATALMRSRTVDLAVLLRTHPSRLSNIRRGDLRRFSLETLIRLATRAGFSVTLAVEQRRFGSRGSSRAERQAPRAKPNPCQY